MSEKEAFVTNKAQILKPIFL